MIKSSGPRLVKPVLRINAALQNEAASVAAAGNPFLRINTALQEQLPPVVDIADDVVLIIDPVGPSTAAAVRDGMAGGGQMTLSNESRTALIAASLRSSRPTEPDFIFTVRL